MPIPDFVLELRRHVGRQQLWLPGVTAVIRHDDSVLLVRRTDNGEWAPVSGIVDPGEEPGVAARREALEETGVTISVDRLAAVKVSQPVVYPNGDRAVYLDHSFACSWVDGEPHVADDESTEVRWFRFDALPR
jgi:8-oxo-dGTP pyrophosphatase MutT (NUDIX family)